MLIPGSILNVLKGLTCVTFFRFTALSMLPEVIIAGPMCLREIDVAHL